jgi:SOS response associated peptidase (SRAP)
VPSSPQIKGRARSQQRASERRSDSYSAIAGLSCAGRYLGIGTNNDSLRAVPAGYFPCGRTLPSFREAYRKRRCILPVDGFFEWKAIKGQKAKQPHAIAMKNGSPFGIGGLWENWKDPTSGEWMRTFAIITTNANELVAEIHDRMPLILAPTDYIRWLSDEPDPGDLMRPFPAEPMRMWPISTRVNKPENDDPSIVERIETIKAAV